MTSCDYSTYIHLTKGYMLFIGLVLFAENVNWVPPRPIKLLLR